MIELLPNGRTEVAIVATPFVTAEVPITVPSLVKETVPVTPLGSVSVKVTAAPGIEGLTELLSVEARVFFATF